jgi:uncharacterized protein (DUF1330 family)
MTVYAVFEVRLKHDAGPDDLAAYDEYRAAVPAMIAEAGGRYLVRAGSGEAIEGAPAGDRFHLIEFDNAEGLHRVWQSEAYRALKIKRAGAVDVRAVLISPPG